MLGCIQIQKNREADQEAILSLNKAKRKWCILKNPKNNSKSEQKIQNYQDKNKYCKPI